MNKEKASRRASKDDTRGIKGLVLALAVSSTIGFWSVFSKVNHDQTGEASSTLQDPGSVPAEQVKYQFVLDLPPVPTLIPPLDPSQAVPEAPVAQSPAVISSPLPFVPEPGKIYIGGGQLGSGPKDSIGRSGGLGKPTTNTRSSR